MTKLKFAHLADLHLGAYREKKLTNLNFETFQIAIQKIIDNKCKFVLFAGDIFNTPIPSLDIVNSFVKEIRKLKKNKIKTYVIGGSHDYSNNQKSFIELLDSTQILKNVGKFQHIDKKKFKLLFTKDDELKICLSGIVGRKNNIEKNIYKNLSKFELNNDYFNIFLFHSTIDDLKPSNMNFKSEINKSALPIGFDYYAGGHIHNNVISNYNDKPISYSGCLFPNNFKELCDEVPSFNLCEFDFKTKKTHVEKIEINNYNKQVIEIEINNKNPIEAKNQILENINNYDLSGKLILLKINGKIDGKIIDIGINKIVQEMYDKDAFIILKNTYNLKSNLIEETHVETNKTSKELEEEIINKNLNIDFEIKLANKIINTNFSKIDEEKNQEYEKRIIEILEGQLK